MYQDSPNAVKYKERRKNKKKPTQLKHEIACHRRDRTKNGTEMAELRKVVGDGSRQTDAIEV